LLSSLMKAAVSQDEGEHVWSQTTEMLLSTSRYMGAPA
jgi:hypothetical protein